jgi:hypothetical protein
MSNNIRVWKLEGTKLGFVLRRAEYTHYRYVVGVIEGELILYADNPSNRLAQVLHARFPEILLAIADDIVQLRDEHPDAIIEYSASAEFQYPELKPFLGPVTR